jgi:hypothetical protein
MSRPRLLADHDLNEHIIDGVRRCEPTVEFLRSRDVGLAGSPNPAVLDYAATQGLIVISHDVNTMPAHAHALLAAGQSMTGLFMVPQKYPVRIIIDNLVLIWAASEAEEWHGQVIFLPL